MGTLTQAKRLVPGLGDGRRASANAYLALIGLVGVVGWGTTALLRHTVSSQRIDLLGSDVFVFGWAGAVVVGWVGLYLLRSLVGVASVDRGVTFSLPELVWGGLVVLGFGATVWGTTLTPRSQAGFLFQIDMMWMPWMAAFAAGYLFTGLVVDRGGVYLAAGVVAAAILGGHLAGVFGLRPPFPLVLLGLLHSVPTFVDAYRGGRQLTDDGVPALKRRDADESAGGVVTG